MGNKTQAEGVLESVKALFALVPLALLFVGQQNGSQDENPTPGLKLTTHGPARKDKVVRTEEQWKKRLTAKQYEILRAHGTEAAFCSPLLYKHGEGTFYCVGCGLPLFSTNAKFDSGTGWPSFFQPVNKDAVWYKLDKSFNMVRTEVNCARCDSHLGHVFDDGPADKGGRRYCMNGEALNFKPAPKK